jgi:hypothetical protein
MVKGFVQGARILAQRSLVNATMGSRISGTLVASVFAPREIVERGLIETRECRRVVAVESASDSICGERDAIFHGECQRAPRRRAAVAMHR